MMGDKPTPGDAFAPAPAPAPLDREDLAEESIRFLQERLDVLALGLGLPRGCLLQKREWGNTIAIRDLSD